MQLNRLKLLGDQMAAVEAGDSISSETVKRTQNRRRETVANEASVQPSEGKRGLRLRDLGSSQCLKQRLWGKHRAGLLERDIETADHEDVRAAILRDHHNAAAKTGSSRFRDGDARMKLKSLYSSNHWYQDILNQKIRPQSRSIRLGPACGHHDQ